MADLKVWAFRRPYCTPSGGTIQASHYREAIALLHLAYGYCSNTRVSCATVNLGQGGDGGVVTKTFDENGEVV